MNRLETASLAVSAGSGLAEESEEPPGTSRRHPIWRDVPDEQWQDWRWQMQNAIRTTLQLAEFMPLGAQELAALESLEAKYKLAIPPYYLSLIDFFEEVGESKLVIPAMLHTALEHAEHGYQQNADNKPDKNIFPKIWHV